MGKTIEEIREEIKNCDSLEKLEMIIKEVDELTDGFEKESLKLKIDDKKEELKSVTQKDSEISEQKDDVSIKISKKTLNKIKKIGTIGVFSLGGLAILLVGINLGRTSSANNIIANKIPTTIEQSIEVESEVPTESFENSTEAKSSTVESTSAATIVEGSSGIDDSNIVSTETAAASTETAVYQEITSSNGARVQVDQRDLFMAQFPMTADKWKKYYQLTESQRDFFRFMNAAGQQQFLLRAFQVPFDDASDQFGDFLDSTGITSCEEAFPDVYAQYKDRLKGVDATYAAKMAKQRAEDAQMNAQKTR